MIQIIQKPFSFQTLPVDKIKALYKAYKIDFEMFEYSPDDYGVIGVQ